jgi:hypothetical protein
LHSGAKTGGNLQWWFDMGISKTIVRVVSIAFSASLAAPSFAGTFADEFSKCVTKYARSTQAATVTLECTAADGKVSDCKVTEAPVPRNGFDKAALCVAEVLPIGTKTGTISFPVKFEPGHY